MLLIKVPKKCKFEINLKLIGIHNKYTNKEQIHNNRTMGLDWMSFELNEEGEEFQKGYYRGKGVAYDKNVEDKTDVCNACYGDPKNVRKIKGDDGEEVERDYIMTEEQKQMIEDALEELLEESEETIEWVESWESYQQWRDWMEGALNFLRDVDYDEGEYIWCWF